MKAVRIDSPGGVENLVVTSLPDLEPGPGQVVIDVVFAGCNWADTQIRRGAYSWPVAYPVVPGYEVSGTVAALGAGVTDLALGTRVAALTAGGGYAERCLADRAMVIPLPDAMALDVAAAFPIQALTAYHMLHTVGRIKRGDTVLVHAIGGGVGLFCTQIAVQAGARVLGTVGTPGKERRALDYGAEKVIIAGAEDFAAAARATTNGRGVDLVIDSLGGDTLDRSFGATRALGHLISLGEAEGRPRDNLRERLMERSQTFSRFSLGKMDPTSSDWRSGIDVLVTAIVDGWLKVPIEGVFPLDAAAAMHARLESRQVAGKLLLAVGK
jgi:NADPH2:quinone reductase